ncbi:MAG: replicative DNA helicase [Clostridia bacterium]|nr:replicative DNA helicase [Clostridia bacterium]
MDESMELRGLTPPSSLEAEKSVLGALLRDPNAVLTAAEQLKEEDFYDPAHREIYSAMMALHTQRSPVDLVTVDTELCRRGTSEGTHGTTYLVDLISYVPTTLNVQAYINIVLEKSTLRKLIAAGQEITKESYQQMTPLQELLAKAEKSIFDIVMKRSDGESLKPVNEVLMNTYEQIEELSRNPGGLAGVPTGFIDLDNYLTGMHGGELILVGARPSMGKTSFAMNIASYAALTANKTVAVFSLEMPREQIVMRMLCSDARVDMQKVRKGLLTENDWMRLAKTLGPMSAAKMYIDDTAAITPTQLRSRCRRLMTEKGLDLIVLDYLGLMQTDSRVESRQLEVSEISRQLKAIAKELNVPLVACAQLSRANKDRNDKRPILSDLRDSGSIEQDADVVMFLHREEYYDHDTEDKNIGEVIIAKQRNGPLGTVKLAWLSEYTTFATLARDPENNRDKPY